MRIGSPSVHLAKSYYSQFTTEAEYLHLSVLVSAAIIQHRVKLVLWSSWYLGRKLKHLHDLGIRLPQRIREMHRRKMQSNLLRLNLPEELSRRQLQRLIRGHL